jgi:hypothetical protein
MKIEELQMWIYLLDCTLRCFKRQLPCLGQSVTIYTSDSDPSDAV